MFRHLVVFFATVLNAKNVDRDGSHGLLGMDGASGEYGCSG